MRETHIAASLGTVLATAAFLSGDALDAAAAKYGGRERRSFVRCVLCAHRREVTISSIGITA
ncbi:hypothetical protein [Acetobacter aceti]|uniref:hypothetical protein n=1 Tax=Acetobacter aceti TaxID=435 RepID=UPI0016274E10|nr:hypothetical protein [Acetobacter aceti]